MQITALTAPPPAAQSALLSTVRISTLLNSPTPSVIRKLPTPISTPASSVVMRIMLLLNSIAMNGPLTHAISTIAIIPLPVVIMDASNATMRLTNSASCASISIETSKSASATGMKYTLTYRNTKHSHTASTRTRLSSIICFGLSSRLFWNR